MNLDPIEIRRPPFWQRRTLNRSEHRHDASGPTLFSESIEAQPEERDLGVEGIVGAAAQQELDPGAARRLANELTAQNRAKGREKIQGL
jgi:hypothetical protein